MTTLDYFLNLDVVYYDYEDHSGPDYFENEDKMKYVFFPAVIEEVVKKHVDNGAPEVAEELSEDERGDILSDIIDECISDFGLIRKLYITDEAGNVLHDEFNDEPYVD